MAIDCHAHYVPRTLIDTLEKRAKDFGISVVEMPPSCAIHFDSGLKLRPFFPHLIEEVELRLAGDPPDVTIFPKLGDVGILEFHRAQSCIAAGDGAATAMVPKIKELVRRLSNGDSPWDNRRRNGREG